MIAKNVVFSPDQVAKISPRPLFVLVVWVNFGSNEPDNSGKSVYIAINAVVAFPKWVIAVGACD